MSSVPADIAGIGSTAMKLRVSPGFDPLKAQVGPDEYFVLSRIDGVMTLKEVLLSTGLPVERGVAIVTKLRSIGALLLPGETAAPAPAAVPRAPTPQQVIRAPSNPNIAVTRAPTPGTGAEPPPAVARTSTPHMVMPTRLPAKPATPLDVPPVAAPPPAAPVIPSVPAMPSIPSMTGATPAIPTKLPAARGHSELDPPTQPRVPAVDKRPPAPNPSEIDPATVPRAPSLDINIVLPSATAEEKAALAEPGDIGPDQRLRILALARLVDGRDAHALLGVPKTADAKVLKRAYFLLSKEIHPDRFYGKQLGSFADRLSVVFEAVSRAYAKLTTPEKRPSNAQAAVTAEQPQTPQEYAAELFDRACGLEVGGDGMGAMKLFAAAVRTDPQTRYLRRAASCALAAEQPKTALEYAKKAQTQSPNDPSSARLLAFAFKACGRLADAEEVLVMAMAIKSENDVLTAELRNDLAEVRRLMAG